MLICLDLIPFRDMQPLQKSYTTLSWILGPEISRTIIKGNDLATEEILKNVSIGKSFLDSNVDIGILEEHCHSQAYKILLSLIHK